MHVVAGTAKLRFELGCKRRAIVHGGCLATSLGRGGLSDDVCSQDENDRQAEERLES